MARKIKKKKKKVSGGDIVIKTQDFIKFMRKVYLSGVFGNALFTFEEEDVFAQLIDLTNTMFISCGESVLDSVVIGKSEFELGIGDLGLLLKFFGTVSQETVSIDRKDNRIIIKRDDGTNLSYLLSNKDTIPTVFKGEGGDPEEKLFDNTDYEIELEQKTRDDFNLYIGMIKTRDVELVLSNGIVSLIGGAETEHRFKINIGEVDNAKEDFSMRFYGDFIQKVFTELDYDEDDENPSIHIGNGSAMVITQGSYVWALVPVGE